MLLEVKRYGDFDIEQTYSVHEVPKNIDIRKILTAFVEEKGLKGYQDTRYGLKITEKGIEGLSSAENTSAEFCRYLEEKGYPRVKTTEISFCD
jgi:hypothetical protein